MRKCVYKSTLALQCVPMSFPKHTACARKPIAVWSIDTIKLSKLTTWLGFVKSWGPGFRLMSACVSLAKSLGTHFYPHTYTYRTQGSTLQQRRTHTHAHTHEHTHTHQRRK